MINKARRPRRIIRVRVRPQSIQVSRSSQSSLDLTATHSEGFDKSNDIWTRTARKQQSDLPGSYATFSQVGIQPYKDTKGPVDDHHREKKSKKPCKKIVLCSTLTIITLVVVAIAITISVLLTRKTAPKKREPVAILRWNSTGTIVAGNGSGGVFGNSLFSPFGFTFDDTNTMYITECTGHRVNKWISQASIGTVVAGSVSRTPSSALSGFNCSADILLDSNGDMYISDRHNDRLQFWQNGASSAVTVAGIGSNTSIRLEGPLGLARDMNTKEIYIASPHSHIVAAYPSGTVFGVTNVTSNVTPHLEGPEGITFDSFSNSLIIANGFGQSIVRWVLGSVNWTLIAGVPGVSGNDSMHLNRPIGLTMDPMGNIYVAEYSNDRVQLFMSGQAEGLTIAGAATNGTQLNGPSAVKLDSQLNLYVSDYLNNRVLKFARY